MKPLLSLSITALTLALTSSGVARADEPAAAAPAGTTSAPVEALHPPSSIRLKLALGGVALAGGAYAVSYAMAASFPEVPGSAQLKIPVVGPWMALGKSGCATDDPDCGAKVVLRGFLLVIDGIAQLGGLGLIAEGIFTKTNPAGATKAAATFTIRPAPLVTGSVTGLGFVGSF